jgi:hypothetical protein
MCIKSKMRKEQTMTSPTSDKKSYAPGKEVFITESKRSVCFYRRAFKTII